MRVAVLSLACLTALAITPAYAQTVDKEDAQALRREIAAMRQALEGMQQRLDRLEQRDGTVGPATAQAPAAPKGKKTKAARFGITSPVAPMPSLFNFGQ